MWPSTDPSGLQLGITYRVAASDICARDSSDIPRLIGSGGNDSTPTTPVAASPAELESTQTPAVSLDVATAPAGGGGEVDC